MNIEDYYKAIKALKVPANLSLADEIIWMQTAVEKLKTELNKDNLLTVLKAEKEWQKKVDSSVN